MRLPWSKPEAKSAVSMVALAQLPGAVWGRGDAASLMRDGFAGNAVAYRCVRMIAEAAASIPLRCGLTLCASCRTGKGMSQAMRFVPSVVNV